MTIGERLKSVRESRKVTQTELGRACGVTKQTIFKYESGIITNIPMDNMERMSALLGVEPAFLLGWSDELPVFPSNLLPKPTTKKVPRFSSGGGDGSSLRQQQVEGYDAVPAELDCSYTMVYHGPAMSDAGIRDGDVVYIRSQGQVDSGALAAVMVNSDQVEVRRFTRTEEAVILLAEHSSTPPQVFTGKAREQVIVVGLVVGFTHRF